MLRSKAGRGRPCKLATFISNNPDNLVPVSLCGSDMDSSQDNGNVMFGFTIDETKILTAFLNHLNIYSAVYIMAVENSGIIFQHEIPSALVKVVGKIFCNFDMFYGPQVPYVFDINVSDFANKLASLYTDAEINVSVEYDTFSNSNVMNLLSVDVKNNREQEETMNLQSLDTYNPLYQNNIDYDVIIALDANEIKKVFGHIKKKNITEINIDYKDSTLILSNNTNSSTNRMKPSDKLAILKDNKTPITLKFNVSSFINYFKSSKICNVVKWYFSNTHGMIIEYNIGKYGVVQYFVSKIN